MAGARIAIIYYSTYGHITKLTNEVVAGAKAAGAEVDVYQFAETLSDEILAKQHAIPRPNIPVIEAAKLTEYDGFIFGFPTRYGRAVAQVSAFFDTTGGIWAKGALVGKFASVYTSTASQHGGIETTALTTMPFFMHQGVNYVPIGYVAPELTVLDSIVGGSAYGAGTIAAGDGSRQPTSEDLSIAKFQGSHFAKTVGTFVAGKKALAAATSSLTAAEAIPASAAAGAATTAAPTTEAKPYTVDAPAGATTATDGTTPATATATKAEQPGASNIAAQTQRPPKKASFWARCCGNESNYSK